MSTSKQTVVSVTELMNAVRRRVSWLFAGSATPAPPGMSEVASPVALSDSQFPDRPRVLVADDHPENGLLLEALLYRWGIRPVQAADGAEAVALACGQHFDLILMDFQMPILDGLTATTQIRRFEHQNSHPRAPIVAYTSSTLGGDWPLLRACGFDDSLEKPCGQRSLEGCLQRWCGEGAHQGRVALAAH